MRLNSYKKNKKIKPFEVKPLLLLIILLVILGLAFWLWKTQGNHKKASGPPPRVNVPRGNLHNTYEYKRENLPHLSKEYSLIYQYNLENRESFAEYLTAKTKEQVKTYAASICKDHGFQFDKIDNLDFGNMRLKCYDVSNTWTFNIYDKWDLYKQPWFKTIDYNVKKSDITWLEIIAGSGPTYN